MLFTHAGTLLRLSLWFSRYFIEIGARRRGARPTDPTDDVVTITNNNKNNNNKSKTPKIQKLQKLQKIQNMNMFQNVPKSSKKSNVFWHCWCVLYNKSLF